MTATAQLGDVAQFVNGLAFKPEDWGVTGRPIIRIQNLTDPGRPFNHTTREVDDRYVVRVGDILVSWSATLGVFEWTGPDESVLNQHIFRVLPDESRVDKRYLKRVLVRALVDMGRYLHGATMQHVNRGEFLATTIPLPSLAEQRRIADILDKADAIRRKRKESIALTEELLRSTFLDMFGDPVTNPKGWPLRKLGELLGSIDSGWSPVCEARPARDEEWGILKLGAVTFGRFDQGENKALTPEIAPVPGLEVKRGDVLFSRKNTYEHVAACVLVSDTRPRLMLPDLIFRLVLASESGLRPETLWALLTEPRMRKLLQGLAGGTAGSMPNISKERLRQVPVPVPAWTLQEKFAAIMHRTETVRRALVQAASESEILFGSVTARAFSTSIETSC